MKHYSAILNIASRSIGRSDPPYIIAEMSANHNNDIERAYKIIKEAKNAGADAVKLQTYTADTMTLDLKDGEFFIDDPKSLWKGQAMHDLYKLAHTPWEWHEPIMKHASSRNLLCFSSPFDESAVDFLERHEVTKITRIQSIVICR